MMDKKKLNIGMTTSIVTILIYLDKQQCGFLVIVLTLLAPFFVALRK